MLLFQRRWRAALTLALPNTAYILYYIYTSTILKAGTARLPGRFDFLALAKGYRGRRKNVFRIAKEAVMRAGQYAYRDRKVKKRTFRALWIQRINAAVRAEGLTYSQFIHGTKLAGIELDRKAMADLAMNEGGIFSAVIAQAKAALPA